MKPHNYLLAIGLFSLVVAAMLLVAVDLHSVYEDMGVAVPVIDENESSAFNQLSEIETQASDTHDEIKGTDVGGEDADTTFFGGAVKSLQIVFRGLAVPGTLFQEIGQLFHIPRLITAFFFTATLIVITWTAVYMIFRFTGQ